MTRWTAVWRPGGWRFLNLQNCWTSGGYGGKGGGGAGYLRQRLVTSPCGQWNQPEAP